MRRRMLLRGLVGVGEGWWSKEEVGEGVEGRKKEVQKEGNSRCANGV